MRASMTKAYRLINLLLILTVGCAHFATRQEKEASFEPFAQRRLGEQTLRDFIEQRTAILVAGAKPLGVEDHGDEIGVRLKTTDADGKVDVGSAAALDSDGYFLTAAHCLRRQPVFLIIGFPNALKALPARVVWQPPESAGDNCDLAVLKLDTHLPGAFVIAGDSDVAVGDPVVTSGANGAAGGKLLRVTINDPDSALNLPFTFTLVHDVPLAHGDSGGPLTTLDGKLIGVEVFVRGVYIGPREGVALRPDTEWLAQIIRKDRAKL
jgi:S1-C subfamily serine protease